jgi:hypothetical protein
MMWPFTKSAREQALEKQLLDLQANCDAKDRVIRVLEAQADALAEVIARDRERVLSETAAYARKRAESELCDGRSD